MHSMPAWMRHPATLIATALIAAGALSFGLYLRSTQTSAITDPLADTLVAEAETFGVMAAPAPTAAPPEPTAAPVVVYVSGAVQHPDVYELVTDARIKDVVVAAGGMTTDADPDQINLAERVTDGQHVYVPHRGEATTGTDAPAADTATGPTNGLIDLNVAGASELEELPGVGQSMAQRIIDYREANGPFGSIEDLQNVKGIGASTFAEIAPLVTVGS